MVWEEWADVIPKADIDLLNIGRQQEIEQPLIDLGYLSGSSEFRIQAHSFQQQLSKAFKQFRKDYFSIGLLNNRALQISTFSQPAFDSLELNLLHQLTGLDGEISIDFLPLDNQVNLWSRVIHYRLMVLGLYQEPVESPFGEKSLLALKQLAEMLHRITDTHLSLANQAGHIPKLTANILATGILRRNVVVFKYQEAGLEKELLEEVNEEKEEQDDEEQLILLEKEVDQEMEKINSIIFTKEVEEWERLEKRNKNKFRRVEKVERSMNKLLAEEQNILTKSLQKEVEIEKTIKLLSNQEEQLKVNLKQLDKDLSQQKKTVKEFQKSGKKELQQKEKEKIALQKTISPQQNIPTVLAQLTQLSQDNRLRNQQLKNFENSGAKRKVIRSLKKDINEEQLKIQQFQKDIKTLKQIEKLEEKILVLKVQSDKLGIQKQKLDLLEKDQKKTKDDLKKVSREKKDKKNDLEQAKIERHEKIGERQLELASLKSRLDRLLEKVNGLTYRFKAQLKRSLDSQYYNQLRHRVFQDRKNDFLEEVSSTPFNMFLIRLIQVRQWMNGYYYGRLDSQPARRTFQSIVEFTEEEDMKKLRLKYVLTKLGEEQNGFWLLNAQYYFDCLVDLDAKAGPKDSIELIRVYENAFEKDPKAFNNEVTKEAWSSYTQEIEEGLQGSEHKIRRFYYGVKSLARSIGRVIGKIIRFIVRGVKTVIRIFKNFIKLLYKEIREGVQNFFDGMGFLFGRRTIETISPTGHRVITKYDFDFDSMVLMSNNTPYDTVVSHMQASIAKTHNLHFSLTLCGKIIKWVYTLATGTLTWPLLAIKIAFHFKELALRFLKERKKRKRKEASESNN